MTQDRSISATFSINSYNLQVSSTTGGSVFGSGSYDYGSSSSILATPQTGYQFVGWTGDGISNTSDANTTVTMTQDRSVSATFSINSYNLQVSSTTGGSVSGSGSYDYGSSASILATPQIGYQFVGWTGDGINDQNSTSTSVLITQDTNISAVFSIDASINFSLTLLSSPISGGHYDRIWFPYN